MVKKYNDYKKFVTQYGNTVKFETVKGREIKVKDSPYRFFVVKGQEILTNIETGITCGILDYVESNIKYINHEISQALSYFGNIEDIPADGKIFPSWYWQFATEFKNLFGFSMPVDICGLDVIKLDSFIRPANGESTNDSILKRYGMDGLNLIHKIMESMPYMFYFYNPNYKRME